MNGSGWTSTKTTPTSTFHTSAMRNQALIYTVPLSFRLSVDNQLRRAGRNAHGICASVFIMHAPPSTTG
eukprot:6478012-Amphidinium_carterae.1